MIPTSVQESSVAACSKKASFSSSTGITDRAVTDVTDVCKNYDDDFNNVLKQTQEAIDRGIFPQLIPAGSSGSYFVYNVHRKPIAVFKPKDEEPFAPLNPKWPKMFQRILCFCCFGRACLIPNVGYLSEAAASLVDERMQLFVIPKTRVVRLYSPTFNYKRGEKKPKEGSFQLFVHDFKAASEMINEWNDNPPSSEEDDEFTLQFHKMCVLDYVIRNTDRHTDNWLIQYKPNETLKIAVIDNGLAFPVKHPECASRFRQFPFNWADLPWAKRQLDPKLRQQLLALLTPKFANDMGQELKSFFRHGSTNNRLLTYSQVRVFRGQLWNLREALEANETPAEWTKRIPFTVTRRTRNPPDSDNFKDFFRKRPVSYTDRACC